MARIFTLPRQVPLSGGSVVPGAKATFYLTGTTTKIDTYSDDELTVPNANPVVADAAGVFDVIYLDPDVDYKLTLTDADDVLIYTEDPVMDTLTAAHIGAILYPTTAAETSAGVTPVDKQYPAEPEIDIRRYDPDSDFDTAFSNAIAVAYTSGLPLRIDEDYNQSAAITVASLSGPLRMIGKGKITYAGSATNYMFRILDTNGNDVEIEDVSFDVDQLASVPVRIDNASSSMADIGIVRIRNSYLENAYLSTGLTASASALVCTGGFKEIILDNVRALNVDRDTGAGTPTLIGSQAILVVQTSITGYCKKLTVIGGEIGPVTNNETTGTADDVDCDGIVYFVPLSSANSDKKVRSTLHVNGTRFVNCKGRLIKSRAGFSIAENVTVIRTLEEAINDARDFGFQSGSGVVRNVAYFVEEKSGGGTTWGTSHVIMSPDFDQLATAGGDGDGSFAAENIAIFSSIPAATDRLQTFCLAGTSDATHPLRNVRLSNISFVGGGVFRIFRSINITGDAKTSITIRDVEGDISTSLVNFTQGVDKEVIVKATGNVNTGAGTPTIFELANNNEPLITGHSNFGFTHNLIPNSSANAVGELLRVGLIANRNADNEPLGAFVPPAGISLIDDASHTFDTVGNFGIGIITSSGGDHVQAMFGFDTSGFTEITPVSSAITFGTTSNPDTDGDLNIWLAGNGQIAIKNRLGITARFALTVFSNG
jgi:hypothetical protein